LNFKVGFGKFSSTEAETVLDKLGIPPNSAQSHKILENYSIHRNSSLFESIISLSPPPGTSLLLFGKTEEHLENESEEISQNFKNLLTLDEKLKKIDEKYLRQDKKHDNLRRAESLSVDQRFRHLALDLERDKQVQLQIAIDRYGNR